MKKVTLLFLFISGSLFSNACSCVFHDNFCESIVGFDGAIWPDFHIYHVKVMENDFTGIKVDILETFHGQDLTGQQILVANGNEADCRISTLAFEVGDEHIFAAWNVNNGWALSICGITFLKVHNGVVTGAVAPGVNSVPLNEFIHLPGCGFEIPNSVDYGVGSKPMVLIQPTLASESFSIVSSLALLDVRVFNSLGGLVCARRKHPFLTSPTLTIDVATWQAGVYFVEVSKGGGKEIYRVIVF